MMEKEHISMDHKRNYKERSTIGITKTHMGAIMSIVMTLSQLKTLMEEMIMTKKTPTQKNILMIIQILVTKIKEAKAVQTIIQIVNIQTAILNLVPTSIVITTKVETKNKKIERETEYYSMETNLSKRIEVTNQERMIDLDKDKKM